MYLKSALYCLAVAEKLKDSIESPEMKEQRESERGKQVNYNFF